MKHCSLAGGCASVFVVVPCGYLLLAMKLLRQFKMCLGLNCLAKSVKNVKLYLRKYEARFFVAQIMSN